MTCIMPHTTKIHNVHLNHSLIVGSVDFCLALAQHENKQQLQLDRSCLIGIFYYLMCYSIATAGVLLLNSLLRDDISFLDFGNFGVDMTIL